MQKPSEHHKLTSVNNIIQFKKPVHDPFKQDQNLHNQNFKQINTEERENLRIESDKGDLKSSWREREMKRLNRVKL